MLLFCITVFYYYYYCCNYYCCLLLLLLFLLLSPCYDCFCFDYCNYYNITFTFPTSTDNQLLRPLLLLLLVLIQLPLFYYHAQLAFRLPLPL